MMENSCEICGMPGLKACPSCNTVSYCSSDHKRAHRKSHKKSCWPILIQDYVSTSGNVVGTTLTASKDLDTNVIILEESPVFVGPFISDSKDADNFLCCVTCGIDIFCSQGRKPKKICSKCFWPVCGVKCQMHTIHSDNECPVFVSEKIKFSSFPSFNEALRYLTMVRAHTLKMDEPKIWKQLVENQLSVPNKQLQQQPVPPIKPGSKVSANGRLKEEQRDYLKICQLVKTKGFILRQQQDPDIVNVLKSRGPVFRRGHYIYQRASDLRHSCAANVNWSIGDYPDFKLRLRTALPIKKGEVLTISRFTVSKDRPGVETTKELFAKNMGEACDCLRCSDPTEFSTFMSALACSSCRKNLRKEKKMKPYDDDDDDGEVTNDHHGYFLPINPLLLPSDPDAEWKCNSCDLITSWSTLEPTIENIRSDLFSISELVDHGKFSMDRAEGRIRNLIRQQRGTFLHPNHWLLQQATYYLMLGQIHRLCLPAPSTRRVMRFSSGGNQNDPDVEDLLKNAKYLLTLQQNAAPGLSRDTAALLISTSFGLKKKVGSMIWDFRPRTQAQVTTILDLLKLRTTLEERALDFYKMELPDRGKKFRHMAINSQNELRSLAKLTETFKIDSGANAATSASLLFGAFLFGMLTIIFFV